MIIDLDVKDTKEFFRVKKILDELKTSPDYQKDRVILLLQMASKLYNEIAEITNDNKIKAWRFSGTKIVSSILTEEEVVNETIKAIEEHLNTDVAIQNLSSLVKFWKGVSKEKDVYKPLLQELIVLVDETRVYLQETKNMKVLKESIKTYEQMITSLKNEAKVLEKSLKDKEIENKHWKSVVRPILDHINILKEHIKIKTRLNPFTTPDLNLFTDILIYLILEDGRAAIEEVAERLNITDEVVRRVQERYKDYLEIGPSGEMIGIIQRKDYKFDLDGYLDRVKLDSEEESNKMKKENEEKIEEKELKEEKPEIKPTKTTGKGFIPRGKIFSERIVKVGRDLKIDSKMKNKEGKK
jgi:hypothetical protein